MEEILFAKNFASEVLGPIFGYFLANSWYFKNHILSSGHQILQARKSFTKQKISILILSFISGVSDLIYKVSFSFPSQKSNFLIFGPFQDLEYGCI